MNKAARAYRVTFQHPERIYEGEDLVESATPPVTSQWPSGVIQSISSEAETVVYRKNLQLFTSQKGDVVAWPSDTIHVEPFCDTVLSITRLVGGKERLRRHYGPGFAISKTVIDSSKPIFLTRFGPCLGSYTTGKSTVVFAIESKEFREVLETSESVDWAFWLSSNDVILNNNCSGGVSGVLVYQTAGQVSVELSEATATFICPDGDDTVYEETYEGADALRVAAVRHYVETMRAIVAQITKKRALNVSVAPFEAANSTEREFEQVFYVLTEDRTLLLVAVEPTAARAEGGHGLKDSEKERVFDRTVHTTVLSSDVAFYKAGGYGLVVYRSAGRDDKRIITSFYGRDDVQELLLSEDESVQEIDASFSRGEVVVYYTSV